MSDAPKTYYVLVNAALPGETWTIGVPAGQSLPLWIANAGWTVQSSSGDPTPAHAQLVASVNGVQPDASGNITIAGGGGAVSTVFGRAGAITAQSGDYTAAQVGLGNVNNTADVDKPVSTAQTAAIAAAIANLVNSAPGALNTLKELADAMGDDPNFAATVTNQLATKIPAWQPNTAYVATQIVVNPSGLIVQAGSSFTSGASYNAANWTVITAPLASPTFTGVAQVNGNTILTAADLSSINMTFTGQGTPPAGLGIDGDRYINELTGDVYVHAGGSWGSPVAQIVAGNALKIGGITVTGAPTAGQALVATSGTAAGWATPAASGGGTTLAPVVKSANYTLAANDFVEANAAGGNLIMTLPTAPADKTQVAVKKTDSSTNTVTVQCGGSDVLNVASGNTSLALKLQHQTTTLQYVAATAVWVIASGDTPLSQLDLRYAAISGSAASLVVAAGALGASQAINLNNRTGLTVTAVANQAASAVSFTGVAAGAQWTMALAQDATGGRTVVWSGIQWLPAGPPVLASGPSAVDVIEFFSPDGAAIYGSIATPHLPQQTMPWATSGLLETYPRYMGSYGSATPTSGTAYLTHFIPDRDFALQRIYSYATTAYSGNTPSLCRMGIYAYNGGNSYGCLARTTNTPANMWNNTTSFASTIYDDGSGTTRSITDGVTYAASTFLLSPSAGLSSTDVNGTVSGTGLLSGSLISSVVTAATATAWSASAARALGDVRRPVTANGRMYQVTTAGTTGSSEPTWTSTTGATVTDGTVTWTDRGAASAAVLQTAASATGTAITVAIQEGGNLIGTIILRAGVEYAFALLGITSGTMFRPGAMQIYSGMTITTPVSTPRYTAIAAGLTDLPAALTSSGNPSFAPWFGVSA